MLIDFICLGRASLNFQAAASLDIRWRGCSVFIVCSRSLTSLNKGAKFSVWDVWKSSVLPVTLTAP